MEHCNTYGNDNTLGDSNTYETLQRLTNNKIMSPANNAMKGFNNVTLQSSNNAMGGGRWENFIGLIFFYLILKIFKNKYKNFYLESCQYIKVLYLNEMGGRKNFYIVNIHKKSSLGIT